MTNKSRALVVYSGGQDSTTCLGWALAHYDEVHALTFHYGQRHAAEVEAACRVLRYFKHKTDRKITHEVLELPANTLAGTSPLTNPNEQLERYTSYEQMDATIGDRVELTFVPMRNALFLMLAANRAAVLDCNHIITGVCQGDNANYPDCRGTFILTAQDTINDALGKPWMGSEAIRIKTPLMHLSKAETVALARSLPHTYEALAFSHTAYDGAYPPTNDHASVLRAHGFEQAGVPDPLLLRAAHEGLVNLETLGPLYTGKVALEQHQAMVADWDGRY